VREREPHITEQRAKLVALIEHMDDGVGRVLQTLEERGLRQNTLVVFTSDNGGQLSVGANNGQLRDGKQSVYEGGLKVPALVAWSDRIAAGTETDFMALTMDLFPTILTSADITLAGEIDGVSFLPTLLGESQPPLRQDWFFRRREGGTEYGGKTIEAIRRGEWKLLQNSPFAPLELYNLKDDPQESRNVIEREREVYQELAAALRREIQRYGSVPWQGP
jgi:arylsulfatase A-like enzyme